MSNIFKTIKFKLPALIVGSIVIVSAITIFISYQDSMKTLDNNITKQFEIFEDTFKEQVITEQHSLEMALSVLLNNNSIKNQFVLQNRNSMKQFLLPLFNTTLKSKYGIAQFQFHTPPATSFLRLHKPEKFGDDLSAFRETVVECNTKQKIVSGIEVGRGGPGLRAVFPVNYNGKHIGSVEFGGSLNKIIDGLSKALKLEYAIGIDKSVFEKARRFGTKDGDIVNGNTIFYHYPHKSYSSNLDKITLDNKIIRVETEENSFAITSIPLINYSNNQIGVITLFADITDNIKSANATLWTNIMIILLATIILGAFGLFISTNIINKPLIKISEFMGEISKGNLTNSLIINSQDEFKFLGDSINKFIDNFKMIISDLINTENTLFTASKQLTEASSSVVSSVTEVSSEISNVASATEQMSININTMSATAEEMSINAQNVATSSTEMSDTTSSVAAAVEEMSMSISDVLKNSNKSSSIAGEAATMSNKATKTMKLLGSAANDIGKVTEVIKRIAEQTNLLALNATIEAASAGEAGKGFAVVANEIKELANQSATAAEDIASKITSVQENTNNAISVIDNVSEIIEKLNESSEIIKNSVEQQTEAVNSIATVTAESQEATESITRNIAEVAEGSSDLAKNASESAEGAGEVSRSVHIVDETTASISATTEEFNSSAMELTNIAEKLKNIIEQFKI